MRNNAGGGSTTTRVREVKFSMIDVSQQVREIVEPRIKAAGLTIDPTASCTLLVEMDSATKMRDPSKVPANVRNQTSVNAIGFRFEVREGGNLVWGNGLHSYRFKKPFDTSKPEAVNYFKTFVTVPWRISKIQHNWYTELSPEGAKSKERGQR